MRSPQGRVPVKSHENLLISQPELELGNRHVQDIDTLDNQLAKLTRAVENLNWRCIVSRSHLVALLNDPVEEVRKFEFGC